MINSDADLPPLVTREQVIAVFDNSPGAWTEYLLGRVLSKLALEEGVSLPLDHLQRIIDGEVVVAGIGGVAVGFLSEVVLRTKNPGESSIRQAY